MELIRAADILIDKIKKDHKDDIALVVVMGSYIYGDTHERSDLDLFYVPKTNRGYDLGFTFIIEGIGFDYWPVSWERLERIAGYEEKTTSIITEGKILYCASEEDRERFDILVRKAGDTADKNNFIKKAACQLDKAYKNYFQLSNSRGLSEARLYAVNIIYNVTFALALLNRITVKRGRGKLKQEIMDMPLVPENFEELYDTVFKSADIARIRDSCGKLIQNTEALISRERENSSEPVSAGDALSGFYEELINFYNKIYHACEKGDAYCALFAAAELTAEIRSALCGTGISPEQLPDILGSYSPENLQELAVTARGHQLKFESLLEDNGIPVRRFMSFDELEDYIRKI
jgi:predicted nucleotidyltransferase